MCADSNPTGAILDGAEDAFEELVEFISEELGQGMAAAGDRRPLVSICAKIDPSSLEWIGR